MPKKVEEHEKYRGKGKRQEGVDLAPIQQYFLEEAWFF